MPPGSVIADRYRIEARIGAGGMGVVYRARDTGRDDAPVAVKIALQADNENHRNRFSREARALSECLAGLQHPGLVQYIDHGLTAAQQPYLVMEWLDGRELAELLRDRPLTEAQTIDLGLQVADALSAAHASGVIHRDIKPSNIFLLGGDIRRAKLLDFGLALLDATMTLATRTGTAMGTPSYMAPEQANTEDSIDRRADLYSLGAVLFACLTGRAPFLGNHVMAILAKLHLEEAPRVRTLVGHISPAMDELIARLLRKRPAERLASADAVTAALQSIRAGRPLDLDHVDGERAATTVVSASENRFTTIALVNRGYRPPGPPPISIDTPTDDPTPNTSLLGDTALATLGHKHGGDLVPLAPLVTMLSFSAERDPTTAASRAARFALAVCAREPTTPVVLATGQRITRRYSSIGDVLERAMSLLGGSGHAADDQDDQIDTVAIDSPARADQGVAPRVEIDEVTASLLAERFEVRSVSGPDARPRFWLERERQPDDTLRNLADNTSSCVGRRRELTLLNASLDECMDEQIGQRVLITGQPGAGKSRLVYELIRYAKEHYPALRIWLARADALRAGSPFGLLAELLTHAMGLIKNAAPEVRLQQVLQHLAERFPTGTSERMAAFLGELIGAPVPDDGRPYLIEARADHQLMNDRLRETWEAWLDSELGGGPVLCVLDDVQWSDHATMRFLSLAMRHTESKPFLLVALGRPQARAHLTEFIGAENDAIHIALKPLSPRACQKLARELAGDALAQDQLGRLIEQCGGNPFYLQELVRHALVDGSLELPESVLAMVSARLAALPADERRVLRAGSVFGAAFSMSALSALLGDGDEAPDASLARLLDRLVHKRMLDRPDGPGGLDESYAFHHEYFREASYGMLTASDRRAAHEQAARWLEEHGERDPVRLAEHFQRAELASEALSWFHRAARQALAADDLDAAVRWAERAIECGATGEERGALRLLQAEALNWNASQILAHAHAREASELLPIGSGKWAHALHMQAWSAAYIEREAEIPLIATRLMQHASADAEPIYEIALAHCTTIAAGFHFQKSAGELLALLNEKEQRGIANRRVRATLAHMKACLADDENDHANACHWFAVAADEWDALEHQRMRSFEEFNLASSLCGLGQFQQCIDILTTGIEDTQGTQSDFVQLGQKRYLMVAYLGLGQFAEARRIWDEFRGSEAYEDPDQGWERTTWHLAAALLELRAGAPDDALFWLDNAPTDSANLPRDTRFVASAIKAQILADRGEIAEALAALARDFDDVDNLYRSPPLAQLVLVETLHASGQSDRARILLAACCTRLCTIAERISNPDWRVGFLHDVTEHRRMLELAREWNLDVPAMARLRS